MRKFYAALTVSAIASLAGTAMADITTQGFTSVYQNTYLNGDVNGGGGTNTTGSRADWQAAAGSPLGHANSFVTSNSASPQGWKNGTMGFTNGVTATISVLTGLTTNSGFFLGRVGTAGQNLPTFLNDGYFDGGDAARPGNDASGNSPIGIAFGNTDVHTARSLLMRFAPGVRGVAFNYDDVGDVGSQMVVTWSNNTTDTITLGMTTTNPNFIDQDGFLGLINNNLYITNLTFTSSTRNNDGFALYNFSTVAVPLPPAAYAGLASLAGVAFIARRRKLAASK